MPDRLSRIPVGLGEQVGAQPQADVVVGRELAQISGQQHIPPLAGGPLENRQEVEPGLAGQRVDRVPGWVEKLRIHRSWNHHQFRALHATGCEGLDIELRWNPHLIHPIAGGNPIGCDTIGFKHRAPDAVVGVREASEEPCRTVGDANAALERDEAFAHLEQSLAVCSGKASGECLRPNGRIVLDAEGAILLQRQHEVDGLAGIAAEVEDRCRPADGEVERVAKYCKVPIKPQIVILIVADGLSVPC